MCLIKELYWKWVHQRKPCLGSSGNIQAIQINLYWPSIFIEAHFLWTLDEPSISKWDQNNNNNKKQIHHTSKLTLLVSPLSNFLLEHTWGHEVLQQTVRSWAYQVVTCLYLHTVPQSMKATATNIVRAATRLAQKSIKRAPSVIVHRTLKRQIRFETAPERCAVQTHEQFSWGFCMKSKKKMTSHHFVTNNCC